jgi:hypothetical protein
MPPENGEQSTSISPLSVLKYLVAQSLRLPQVSPTELEASLTCARFQRAETAEDYLSILASVLAELPLVYILMDVEIVDIGSYAYDSPTSFSWPAILNVFEELDRRAVKTQLKVIFFSYGSSLAIPESRQGAFNKWGRIIHAPVDGKFNADRTRWRRGHALCLGRAV